MTREEALQNLNLSPEATREEIESAYRRMVRRYPPEFQPDRFRIVDESYRLLTSLSFLLESILSSEREHDVEKMLSELDATADEDAVEKSLKDVRTLFLKEVLWPRSRSHKKQDLIW